MSRARTRKVDPVPTEIAGMDTFIDKSLKDTFADLEPPKASKFSASDALLSKILKDKSKKQKDEQKRAKEAEKRKLAGVDSDWDEEQAEEEATVKKAKFEESRAEMKRKFQESSGPPIFRQCLFPSETVINSVQNRFARQDTEVELRQDTDLSKAIPNTITDYLGMATTSRELLLGGWVQWQYTRQPPTNPGVQENLLRVATQSSDTEMGRKAYTILTTLLGAADPLDQLLGRQYRPETADIGFYKQSRLPSPNCQLADSHFMEAFVRSGYSEAAAGPNARAQRAGRIRKADASNPAEPSGPGMAAWEDASKAPRLGSLQMLLRVLVQVCRLQAQQVGNVALNGGGIQQLFLTVLNLRMDPVGCLLAVDLEAAAEALLDAFSEADWARKFSDLTTQVARLGGSHRGAVQLIRLLPSHHPRGDLLRGHAAAHLLSSLLQPKGKKPAGSSRSRGLPGPVDVEAVVSAQSWFEAGEGFLRLAKSVNQGALSIWELQSSIELVDLLLWPHVKRSRETGGSAPCAPFIMRWRNFCQKLSTFMSKDDQGAALKLLITTIITRDNITTL